MRPSQVHVLADTLPSFSTEATDPKYIVAVDTHGAAPEEIAAGGRSLLMRDSRGRQFLCRLPENVTQAEEADGLVRTMPQIACRPSACDTTRCLAACREQQCMQGNEQDG